jgi:hemerythrin superfamily protein
MEVVMNAIELLESQHREVEDLFSKIAVARTTDTKETLFTRLADALAVHSAIEEHNFYPGVKAKQTEEILIESLEAHLVVKRLLSELLDLDCAAETFDEKLRTLEGEVAQHVAEEEGQLFPRVRELLDDAELEALGQEMSAEQTELEERGNPRSTVPSQTERPATI